MQERNVIQGMTSMVLVPFLDFYGKLVPFMLFGMILIIVDLRFGIQKSKFKKEEIRTSRAVRRTLNKMVDYICWITLAGLFGHSFGEILGIPILAGLMLLIVYGIEINSCYSNYFEARGINKKINIFKLFGKKDLEDCIEKKEDV